MLSFQLYSSSLRILLSNWIIIIHKLLDRVNRLFTPVVFFHVYSSSIRTLISDRIRRYWLGLISISSWIGWIRYPHLLTLLSDWTLIKPDIHHLLRRVNHFSVPARCIQKVLNLNFRTWRLILLKEAFRAPWAISGCMVWRIASWTGM